MSYFIGLLSGTSVDSIDAGLVHFSDDKIKFIEALSHPFPLDLKQRIQNLIENQSTDLASYSEIDVKIAIEFSKAANALIKNSSVSKDEIIAIGSHGQTIFHNPEGEFKNTIQIGNPHTIAAQTQLPVVTNFRNMDMALGGQGAPLAPLLHHEIFREDDKNIAVLNLGGIANITFLGHDYKKPIGYDTGPANCLIDSWISTHQNKQYDESGDWAKAGNLNKPLLNQFLTDKYFKLPNPKSTGREHFNINWLNSILAKNEPITPIDVQTTLTHLTAKSVALEIEKQAFAIDKLVIMGGGSSNLFLKELLTKYCQADVVSSECYDYDPDWVESILFAYLAYQRWNGINLDLKTITGSAEKLLVGDVIYPPK